MSMTQPLLQVGDVLKISGVHRRSLRYWLDQRLVDSHTKPTRRGDSAQFSLINLLHIYIVKELLESGINLKTVNLVMEVIRKYDYDAINNKILLTNGRDYFKITSSFNYKDYSSISPLYIMRFRVLCAKALRDIQAFHNNPLSKEKTDANRN